MITMTEDDSMSYLVVVVVIGDCRANIGDWNPLSLLKANDGMLIWHDSVYWYLSEWERCRLGWVVDFCRRRTQGRDRRSGRKREIKAVIDRFRMEMMRGS
jgi:hypothetical protein